MERKLTINCSPTTWEKLEAIGRVDKKKIHSVIEKALLFYVGERYELLARANRKNPIPECLKDQTWSGI